MKRIANFFVAASVAAAPIVVSCDKNTIEGTVPSVEFGSLTSVSETEVSIEIVPSENAEAIYWSYAEEGAAPGEYTKVEGNAAVEVSMDVTVEKSYTVYAYAENSVGKSETIEKDFTVSRIPADILETGAVEVTRGGIVIPLTLSETAGAVHFAVSLSGTGGDLSYMRVNLADLADGKLFISNAYISDNGKYTVSLYASNDFGESEPVEIEVEYDESQFAELVNIDIENLSPVSMDARISMKNGCTKYVVGAFVKSAYDKKSFIESAQRSISPDPSYPMQPFVVAETDATFDEQNLTKSTVQTDPSCKGIRLTQETDYIVAVYAIDADGYASVYTAGTTTPSVEFGQCQTTVSITATSTLSSVIPTYTVNGSCDKLVLGYLPKDWVDPDPDSPNGGISDWNDETQIVNYIKKISNEMPVVYEGKPITQESPVVLESGQEVLIYAFAINEKGQLGQLGYGMFAASRPVLDGEGEVTSLIVKEVTFNNVQLQVMISDKSEKVRIMVISEGNYHLVSDDLDWTMSDGENNSQWWSEFTRKELADADNIVNIHANYPESKYYIHAVTVDAVGKVSPVQSFGTVETPAEETEPVEEVDFSGTGELVFNKISETVIESYDQWSGTTRQVEIKYSVSKGSNTKTVYYKPLSDIIVEDAEQYIKNSFNNFNPEKLPFGVTEFSDFDVERTFTTLGDYDPKWGGYGFAFITLDNDSKLKIAVTWIGDSSKVE